MKYLVLILASFLLSGIACSEQNIETEMEIDREETDTLVLNYLALGDSYTIGESVGSEERFPYQLINSALDVPHKTGAYKIIARTGWTTRNLLNAVDDENLQPGEYDFITLLIGVNNQFQGIPFSTYETEFIELMDRAVNLLNGKADRLIVVSIPDYGVTPFGENRNPEKIAREIDQYNDYNQQITEDKGARYVYITDLTKLAKEDLSLLANDQLHPSGKSYAQWVERILPELNEIVKDL